MPCSAELNEVKQLLHADNFDADVTLRITAELDQCKDELEKLTRKLPKIEELTLARKGILDDLARARDNQSRVRQDAADLIRTRLSQRLEVVVEPLGDREQFAADLRTLLAGSGRPNVGDRRRRFPRRCRRAGDRGDGRTRSRRHRGSVPPDDGTSRQDPQLAHRPRSRPTRRPRSARTSRPRRRATAHEAGSRDLDQLSTGQRTTAILLLIFAVDGKPMLLDPPEDDLDNSFIYEDVVAIIRK